MTNSAQRSLTAVQAAGGGAAVVRVCAEKGASSRASANQEPKRMRRRYPKNAASRSARVGRAERGQDAVAIVTTQLERGVIVEHDVEVAVPARADFADAIEIDQRRAMDPRERRRIQLRLQVRHRAADQEAP